MARLVALVAAVIRRSKVPVAIRQCIEQAAMPHLAGPKAHLETEPSIGVHRLRRGSRCGDRHGAAEIGVAVGRTEMLAWFGPVGGNPPSTHNAARLHLENIG